MTEPFPKIPSRSGPSAADDLFDVPVEALNLPGMDALDATAALAEFARAEPAIAALANEPVPLDEVHDESLAAYEASEAAEEAWEAPPPAEEEEEYAPAPRSRRVWIALSAMVLGSALAFTLGLSKHSATVPTTAEAPPPSDGETGHEPATHTTVHEVHVPVPETIPAVKIAEQEEGPSPSTTATKPPEATPPVATTVHEELHAPLSGTILPAPTEPPAVPISVATRDEHVAGATRDEHVAGATRDEHSALATRNVPAPLAGRDIQVPPPSRSGLARLQVVESALAEGRRAYARREIGRILLDADALPAAEREETRAQAELLVARILQESADEARRSAR